MRVELTPRARLDLIEIGDYLERVAGKRIAARWVSRLNAGVLSLARSPFAGAEDPQLGARRRLVVRPYLIVYRVASSDLVRVVRIVHGARDLPGLFAMSED